MLPSNRFFGRLALASLATVLVVGWGGNILESYGYIGADGLSGPLAWILMAVLFGALFLFAVSVVPLGARSVCRRFTSSNQALGSNPAWAQGIMAGPDRAADRFTIFVWVIWALGAMIAIPAMILDLGLAP